ncbi:MAG: NUDIX hydrolase [Terrabacter sp.]
MAERTSLSVAALVGDGLVLLVHRHPSREHYPDCWDLVGGHVEPGESPRQAVSRECLEELGVRIHEPRPIQLAIDDPTLEVHAFVVTRWDGLPSNAAPEQHDDLRWFGVAELADLRLAHPGSLASLRLALTIAADPSPAGSGDVSGRGRRSTPPGPAPR